MHQRTLEQHEPAHNGNVDRTHLDPFLKAFMPYVESYLISTAYSPDATNVKNAPISYRKTTSACETPIFSTDEKPLDSVERALSVDEVQSIPFVWDQDGSTASVFFLPSVHSIVGAVGEHIYILDMRYPSEENVIIKQWTSHGESSGGQSSQNAGVIAQDPTDRIVTIAALIDPSNASVAAPHKVEHILLLFTARGKLLVYTLEKATNGFRLSTEKSAETHLDEGRIILQQRLQQEMTYQSWSSPLVHQAPHPAKTLAALLQRKVVENPNYHVISDLPNEYFEKRYFAVPANDSFLHGHDGLAETHLVEWVSGGLARAQEKVIRMLGNAFTLSEPQSPAKGAQRHFKLNLPPGEYVCKVVQHLPTRSIILLTQNVLKNNMSESARPDNIYQLSLASPDNEGVFRRFETRIARLDLEEPSMLASVWQCFRFAAINIHKSAEKVMEAVLPDSMAFHPSKRRKYLRDVENRSEAESGEAKVLEAFEAHQEPFLTAVTPPSLSSSSMLPRKPEESSNAVQIIDIAIDDSRDYLYTLQSDDCVVVYEILNAGWSQHQCMSTNKYAEADKPLRLRRAFFIDHSEALRGLSAEKSRVQPSPLVSITCVSGNEGLTGTYEEVCLHAEDTVEKLFIVRSKSETYVYGFYISAKRPAGQAVPFWEHRPANIPTFEVVLYKACKIKQFATEPNEPIDLTSYETVHAVAPTLAFSNYAVSFNAVHESTPIPTVTTSTVLTAKASPTNWLIESILARNIFSSAARGALRAPMMYHQKHAGTPYFVLVTRGKIRVFAEKSPVHPLGAFRKYFTASNEICRNDGAVHSFLTGFFDLLEDPRESVQSDSCGVTGCRSIDELNGKLLDGLRPAESVSDHECANESALRMASALFEFQWNVYCASFLSASASVDVSFLPQCLGENFFQDIPNRTIKTQFTKGFSLDATTATFTMPSPSFFRSLQSRLMNIIGPLMHQRILHYAFVNDTFGTAPNLNNAASFREEFFDTQGFPTLSVTEIETLVDQLVRLQDFAANLSRQFRDQQSHHMNKDFEVLRIVDDAIHIKFLNTVSLTQISRVDISQILAQIIENLSAYIQRVVQALRFVQLIYDIVNTHYRVRSGKPKSNQSFVVRFVHFWQIHWSASSRGSVASEPTASQPTPREGSPAVTQQSDHSLLHLYHTTFGCMFTHWSATDGTKTRDGFFVFERLYISFVRALFSFISSVAIIESGLAGQTRIVQKTAEIGKIEETAVAFASELPGFHFLFTREERCEIELFTKLSAIRKLKVELRAALSPETLESVQHLERELQEMCYILQRDHTLRMSAEAMAGLTYHFALIARLNDVLVKETDRSSAPNRCRRSLNYYNLCALVWNASLQKITAQKHSSELEVRLLEPLWFHMTQHLLSDGSAYLNVKKSHDALSTRFDTLLTEGKSSALFFVDYTCFERLVAGPTSVWPPDHGVSKNASKPSLSPEVKGALSTLFGIDESFLRHGLFFKRMLQWAAYDTLMFCGSTHERSQTLISNIYQLREQIFTTIFHSIRSKTEETQRILIKECESFLVANKHALCEVLVDFYQMFSCDSLCEVPSERQILVLLDAARKDTVLSGSRVEQTTKFIQQFGQRANEGCLSSEVYKAELASHCENSAILSYRLSLLEKAHRISSGSLLRESTVHSNEIHDFLEVTRIQLRLTELIGAILRGDESNSFPYVRERNFRRKIEWDHSEYFSTEFLIDAFSLLAHISVFSEPSAFDVSPLARIPYNTQTVNGNIVGLLFHIADTCKGSGGEIIQLQVLSAFYPFDAKLSKYSFWTRRAFEDTTKIKNAVISLTKSFLLGTEPTYDSGAFDNLRIDEIAPKAEYILQEFMATKISHYCAITAMALLELCRASPIDFEDVMISAVPFRLFRSANLSGHRQTTIQDALHPLSVFDVYWSLLKSIEGASTGHHPTTGTLAEVVHLDEIFDNVPAILATLSKDSVLFAMVSTLYIWWKKIDRGGVEGLNESEPIRHRRSVCWSLLRTCEEHDECRSSQIRDAIELMLRKMHI